MELNQVVVTVSVIVMIGIVLGLGILIAENIEDETSEKSVVTSNQNILTSSTETLTSIGEGITSNSATRHNQTWLEFDGVDDNVLLANKYTPSNTTGQSFSIWFKLAEDSILTNSNSNRIIGNGYFFIYIRNSTGILGCDGNLIVGRYTSPASKEVSVCLGNKDDEWHNLIFNYYPTQITDKQIAFYLDGVPALTSVYTTYPSAILYNGTSLGALYTNYFNGSINSFIAYNKTLGGLEARELYFSDSKSNNKSNLKTIPVLMYHNISDSGLSYNVKSTNFIAQMTLLNSSGYETITDIEYYNWTQNQGFIMPEKPIMITFDDGFRSVRKNASVEMAKYGFKGVFAVTTSLIESGASTDYMNWTQVNETIYDYNWSIVSHSSSHCHLGYGTDGSGATWCNDSITMIGNLSQSKVDIITNTGITPISFIFPYNDWGNRLGTNFREYQIYPNVMGNCSLNYTLCFGSAYEYTAIKYITKETNLINGDMGRINIDNETSLQDFELILNKTDYSNNLYRDYKLNENSGTIAYDVSGNGNNGTISGATWNNDGINVSLTEDVDYSISGDTFTILNTDYAWDGIFATYTYDQQDYYGMGDGWFVNSLGTFADWIAVIVVVIGAGIVLTIILKNFSNSRVGV